MSPGAAPGNRVLVVDDLKLNSELNQIPVALVLSIDQKTLYQQAEELPGILKPLDQCSAPEHPAGP